MRRRRALPVLLALVALAVPSAAYAAGYGTSGGEALPADVAGGIQGPEPVPEPVVPASAATPRAIATPGGAASPYVVTPPPAQMAQTPVEPEPGARPGEERPDPFAPAVPAAPREQADDREPAPLPLSGASLATVFTLGAFMLALGIAGLAASRTRSLSA